MPVHHRCWAIGTPGTGQPSSSAWPSHWSMARRRARRRSPTSRARRCARRRTRTDHGHRHTGDRRRQARRMAPDRCRQQTRGKGHHGDCAHAPHGPTTAQRGAMPGRTGARHPLVAVRAMVRIAAVRPPSWNGPPRVQHHRCTITTPTHAHRRRRAPSGARTGHAAPGRQLVPADASVALLGTRRPGRTCVRHPCITPRTPVRVNRGGPAVPIARVASAAPTSDEPVEQLAHGAAPRCCAPRCGAPTFGAPTFGAPARSTSLHPVRSLHRRHDAMVQDGCITHPGASNRCLPCPGHAGTMVVVEPRSGWASPRACGTVGTAPARPRRTPVGTPAWRGGSGVGTGHVQCRRGRDAG